MDDEAGCDGGDSAAPDGEATRSELKIVTSGPYDVRDARSTSEYDGASIQQYVPNLIYNEVKF